LGPEEPGQGEKRRAHKDQAGDAPREARAVSLEFPHSCSDRVRRWYQTTIRTTETRRIRVDTALISGVMPRRSRPQIAAGRVESRPYRKKVTAISSIERVKIKSAAAMSGSRRLGRVTRQKVRQGEAPRSSDASSCRRSSFWRPA